MRRIGRTVIIFIISLLAIAGCNQTGSNLPLQDNSKRTSDAETNSANKPYKIVHIMSYHSPWEWTDRQLIGFKESLQDLNVDYKVLQMDAKKNSSEAWLEQKGKEARALIDDWKPDLVYTSDDEAQEYVTRQYLNKNIPFVFSGVNSDPVSYGFTDSDNVTGVLEREHFVENVKLIKELVPSVRKVAAVFDDSPIWKPVIFRMKSQLEQLKDVEFTSWDIISTYQEYQDKIREYQTTVDAVALIGIFNFKDASSQNVDYRQVLKWTAENSMLPDFSYWSDRATYGTLATVTVSGYEQGHKAGMLARAILLKGKKPSELKMEATKKGEPIINLARANKLGIKVNSSLLLGSKILTQFEWEK